MIDSSTLFNITQRLGGSIGVSILGSIVAGGATLAATIDNFHLVGGILIAIAAVSAVLALFLQQERGKPVPLVNTVGE